MWHIDTNVFCHYFTDTLQLFGIWKLVENNNQQVNQLTPCITIATDLMDKAVRSQDVVVGGKRKAMVPKQRRSAMWSDGRQQERLPVAFHSGSE